MDSPNNLTEKQKKWRDHIYKEVDGFYYFDPIRLSGTWTSDNLREIADLLDTLNAPWVEKLKELTR